MKHFIGVSRDHSASMDHLTSAARNDYNSTVDVIKSQSTGIETSLTVVQAGDGRSATVRVEFTNRPIDQVAPLNYYEASAGGTPLFDSVGDLITILESQPGAKSSDATFMVMAITDGAENASRRWPAHKLMAKIRQLQETDRWTFVFRVPRGYSRTLVNLGIPAGNILEWDQTSRGVAEATQATAQAFTAHYSNLRSGVKSTTKFYTNMKDVDINTVKAKLVDISSEVTIWTVTQKAVIRPYIEQMTKRPMIKGAAFYQLTKTENEVQDYKQIVIRDKKSGAVYGGAAARQLLNLPTVGTTKVAPGDHGQYDIYIQSTSINRALPGGTQLLYWPDFNKPAGATPQVSNIIAAAKLPTVQGSSLTQSLNTVRNTPVTQVVTAVQKPATTGASQQFIAGYRDGFPIGRVKNPHMIADDGTEYAKGFLKGYKDGRGKQKRLYK